MEKNKKQPLRYEFRVFGNNLNKASRILASLKPIAKNIKSRELYILLKDNETINIKIRNDKLEIKILIEVIDDLQKWEPVLIEAFPISKETIEKYFSPLVKFEKEKYTKDDLLNLLKNKKIKTVSVDKTRTKYLLDTILFETAHIDINGREISTLCLESDNIDKLKKTIQNLKLEHINNSSYIKLFNHL